KAAVGGGEVHPNHPDRRDVKTNMRRRLTHKANDDRQFIEIFDVVFELTHQIEKVPRHLLVSRHPRTIACPRRGQRQKQRERERYGESPESAPAHPRSAFMIAAEDHRLILAFPRAKGIDAARRARWRRERASPPRPA